MTALELEALAGATDRAPIKFDFDLARMVVRIGVLPSALSIEASRAWAELPLEELQDVTARVTMAANAQIREARAALARNGGVRPRGAPGT